MPTPRKNESKNKFISRCIEYVMEEEDLPQEEAQGRCYGIWESNQKASSESVMHITAIKKIREVTADG